jgi:PAS domain S-box-containing protein
MGATGQQKQRNSGKDRGKDTVNNSANNNATGGDLGSRDVRTAVHGDIQALEQRLEGLRQRAARLDEPGSVSAYVAELDACLSTLRVAEEELLAWEAQQEMALATVQQERQRYQDLFDWAPGAHLVTDAAGLIQEANQAAADLLGLSPRALRGKPLAAFLIDDTDDEQDDGKQQHEQQDGGKDGHQTLRRLLLEAAFGASVRGQIHEVQACLKPHKAALLRVRVRVSSSAGSLRWLLHEVVPQQQQHGGAANDVVLRADLARQRHIAATLQSALLPPLRDSAFAGLSVVTRYAAAAESEARVGGDFYDAFLLPDGRVALVVGDVSGKGLAAATRGAEARHALRAYLRADPKHPAQALARLNEYLCLARDLDEPDSNGSAGFLVLSLAVVDPSSGVTQVACAGAEPPFVLLRQSHARVTEHRSHSGTTADTPDASAAGTITGPVDVLPSGGLLLGLQAAETYPVHTLVLHPGDVLVMVTDGLTEARAASGSTGSATLLGYDGLVRLAATAAGTAKEEQEEEELLPMLADSILNGARAFAQGVLHDDACLLLAARSSTDSSSTEEDNAEPPRQQTTQAVSRGRAGAGAP